MNTDHLVYFNVENDAMFDNSYKSICKNDLLACNKVDLNKNIYYRNCVITLEGDETYIAQINPFSEVALKLKHLNKSYKDITINKNKIKGVYLVDSVIRNIDY